LASGFTQRFGEMADRLGGAFLAARE